MEYYTVSSERFASADHAMGQPHPGYPHVQCAPANPVEPFYDTPYNTYALPGASLPPFDYPQQYYPSFPGADPYHGAPPVYYPSDPAFFPPAQAPPPPPLAAHIPISDYSSLLPPASPSACGLPQPVVAAPAPIHPFNIASLSAPAPAPVSVPLQPEHLSPLEQYSSAPQIIFPTPSELLTDLTARPTHAGGGTPVLFGRPTHAHALAHRPRRAAPPPPAPDPLEKKSENQRKAYFRAVAEDVGFQPTDPDTITSHDKKRHYLECLEHYVLWLHEQVQLVGQQPIPLERVSEYPGLHSRSIRTLLVHMQTSTRKLNQDAINEENRFYELEDELIAFQNEQEMRRHSV